MSINHELPSYPDGRQIPADGLRQTEEKKFRSLDLLVSRQLEHVGLPREALAAIRRYSRADVYEIVPLPMQIVKNPEFNATVIKQEIWIGSAVSSNELKVSDLEHDPKVIVAWVAKSILNRAHAVERVEVHPLSNGRFVRVRYANVVSLGEFDGEITQVVYGVPESTEYHQWRFEREPEEHVLLGSIRVSPLVLRNAVTWSMYEEYSTQRIGIFQSNQESLS